MVCDMRVLLVGAGGVGTAVTHIAARRGFLSHMVVADYDLTRAEAAVAAHEQHPGRFSSRRLDASHEDAVRQVLVDERCDVLLNATDPRFVMPLFNAALAAGTHYLDMAMSLSTPHTTAPYEQCGVKLGDEQFAQAEAWDAPAIWPWSAWAWSRGFRTSSRGMRPMNSSTRSRRSVCATART